MISLSHRFPAVAVAKHHFLIDMDPSRKVRTRITRENITGEMLIVTTPTAFAQLFHEQREKRL